MERILYKEKISIIRLLIGYSFLIIGLSLLLLIELNLYPILTLFWIALVIGGVVILSNEGIELDLKYNLYRNITSIFGLNLGNWEKIPETNYISVFRTNLTKKIGGLGLQSTATASITEKAILINLFDDNRKPTTLYITKNEKLALEICEKLKEKYGFKIVNKLYN